MIIFFKVASISLIALFACWLPSDTGRIHEVDTIPVKQYKPVSALPTPKVATAATLQPIAPPKPPEPPKPTAAPVKSGGNCASWMAQAGIPSTYATNKLILNESGCKWWARNPSSGACGIPQALPCSKMPCPLTEAGAVCQLRWMDNYVKVRYGSWNSALAAWQSRSPHWY